VMARLLLLVTVWRGAVVGRGSGSGDVCVCGGGNVLAGSGLGVGAGDGSGGNSGGGQGGGGVGGDNGGLGTVSVATVVYWARAGPGASRGPDNPTAQHGGPHGTVGPQHSVSGHVPVQCTQLHRAAVLVGGGVDVLAVVWEDSGPQAWYSKTFSSIRILHMNVGSRRRCHDTSYISGVRYFLRVPVQVLNQHAHLQQVSMECNGGSGGAGARVRSKGWYGWPSGGSLMCSGVTLFICW
jgi:hypothetical protein